MWRLSRQPYNVYGVDSPKFKQEASMNGTIIAYIVILLFIVAIAAISWYLTKRAEEKRVANILELKDQLGDEMCQWLIQNKNG